MFKGCEVLVECVVLKANLIQSKMLDFDVILGMDWLSNHRASMNCFTKKIQFEKPGYPELEFVGDRRILPTCVIFALKAKRLLLKRCESYLAYVLDTFVTEVNLENVPVAYEFLDFFRRIYRDCHQIENQNLEQNRLSPYLHTAIQNGNNGIERIKDPTARFSR